MITYKESIHLTIEILKIYLNSNIKRKTYTKQEIKNIAKKIPKHPNLSKRGVALLDDIKQHIIRNENKIRDILRDDTSIDLDRAFWLLKETGTRTEQAKGREMIRKALWRRFYSK